MTNTDKMMFAGLGIMAVLFWWRRNAEQNDYNAQFTTSDLNEDYQEQIRDLTAALNELKNQSTAKADAAMKKANSKIDSLISQLRTLAKIQSKTAEQQNRYATIKQALSAIGIDINLYI